MRKLLITLAVAGSALAVSAPAAAQWAPPQQPYGYGYGHQNNFGQARALQVRVDQIQRELGRLAQYRMISRGEYNNRQRDARQIERKLRRDYRDGRGITPREMYDVQRQIVRLEQKIARDTRDGRRFGHRW